LAAAAGHHLVVFVPATLVSLASVELRAKSRRQMLAAAPYMLEDELCEDVDNLHFALATIDRAADRQLVGAVSREFIGGLHAAISAHQFQSAAVVPLTLAIPHDGDSWSLFLQDDVATLRTGKYQGYGIDGVNLEEVLSAERDDYRRQHDEEVEIVEYDFRPAAGGHDSEQPEDSQALAMIGRYWLDHDHGFNLLQGSFQVRNVVPGSRKLWLTAAALAGLCVLLFLLQAIIGNAQLQAQSDQLEEAMHRLYTQTFHDGAPADAAAEMRKRIISLRESRGGPVAPFLQFVAASSRVLLNDSESRVVRMSYNNKRMEIDIETTAFEKLESLQQQLSSERLRVELKAVTNINGKINGRLVLAEVEA
jgi:general secretion pathway protein L